MTCNGSCDRCAGCSRELLLTQGELEFLKKLGQFAFLPVAREPGSDIPHFPEADTEEMSLILQLLEKKGLISLDFRRPLLGFSGENCRNYPISGSIDLTERGQNVLELVEYQGIRPEE